MNPTFKALLVSVIIISGFSPPAFADSSRVANGKNLTLETVVNLRRLSIGRDDAIRITTEMHLEPKARSRSVNAWLNNYSDEGSFQHWECVTYIAYVVGRATVSVEAPFGTSVRYERDITAIQQYASPADSWSSCQPHGYPDFRDTLGATFNIEPIDIGGGLTIEPFSLSAGGGQIAVVAFNQGAYWDMTELNFTDGMQQNPQIFFGYTLNGLPERQSDYSRWVLPGARSPHRILGKIEVADCSLNNPVQRAIYNFDFDYTNALPIGAKVWVKYSWENGFTLGSAPEWNDARALELVRRGDDWTGQLSIPNMSVRLVPDFPDESIINAITGENTDKNYMTALLYVFKIVDPNGTIRYENGSAARWGHYVATRNGGRNGHWGMLLSTQCNPGSSKRLLDSEAKSF